jgi:hypothetical protein
MASLGHVETGRLTPCANFNAQRVCVKKEMLCYDDDENVLMYILSERCRSGELEGERLREQGEER